jgi:argininosuccinate synthase
MRGGDGLPEWLRRRLEQQPVPALRRAVLAYSGGLDSLLCLALLDRVYACDQILAVIGDIGQPREVIDEAVERARRTFGGEVRRLDLRAPFLDDWLVRAIRANAQRDGYPLAAPMIKQLLGRHLGELAQREGYEAVVDGATGVGNDQFRIAAALARFAPDVQQVSPIRQLQLSRTEELELCDRWGLDYDRRLARGGDDLTPWCRAISSGSLSLSESLDAYPLYWVERGSQRSATFELVLSAGVPVGLDGESLPLEEVLARLNRRAGECGLGLVDLVEDNLLGAKSRELYEAPAALVILRAKAELEALCLSAEERWAKRDWERQWTELVYRGEAFHPLVAALDGAIEVVQRRVSGEVTVRVTGGAQEVVARCSPLALFSDRESPLVRAERQRVAGIDLLEHHRAKYRKLGAVLRMLDD